MPLVPTLAIGAEAAARVTAAQRFPRAASVPDLGDPGAPLQVLSPRLDRDPVGQIEIDDLRVCLGLGS